MAKHDNFKNEILVLKALIRNSKLSVNDIAGKTKLSRQTVSNIKHKLENTKNIWGYTIGFNPEHLDYKHYVLLAKGTPKMNTDKTVVFYFNKNREKINQHDAIFICTSVLHGEYDLMVQFLARGTKQAREISFLILEPVMEQVLKYHILEGVHNLRMLSFVNPEII